MKALGNRQAAYRAQAAEVAARARRLERLGAAALAEEAARLRPLFLRGRETPAERLAGLALARVLGARTLDLRHYDVQIMASLASLDGYLVEMATGEGKSLVAATVAALSAWRGRGVHVVTVNDYLARRDAERFQPLFEALGVRALAVCAGMAPAERAQGYAADVTYLTSKEAAADFLRDRLARAGTDEAGMLVDALCGIGRPRSGQTVQRGLEQAIVDEADSVLIDDAVTPLILSGSAPGAAAAVEDVQRACGIARVLERGRDFRIDPAFRVLELTDAGRERVEALGHGWRSPRIREELVARALSARHLFHRGVHYVVLDGKVVIVDEATGRLMPDRSWRDGLHQAVEAKEGVEITPPKETLARISFQRFFRRYRRLCGMTGTAWEARAELERVYGLEVLPIPLHRPCLRKLLPPQVHATAEARWSAVVAETARQHSAGRPVLIGTRTVAASERVSEMLHAAGLPHAVLNAVNHAQEAEIVARAGQRGAITVATNMAGRGTDIALGPGVAELGGLHVIATERHESARVDRQLFGRAARQGNPGSAVAIVSLEDELVTRHFPAGALARRSAAALPQLVFRLAQARIGARQRRVREQLMDQDRQLQRQLGFAGAEH